MIPFISLRKTVRKGPFNVTFSKSGVTVSVGTKHFRISCNTKGQVGVSTGAGGVRYRKNIKIK